MFFYRSTFWGIKLSRSILFTVMNCHTLWHSLESLVLRGRFSHRTSLSNAPNARTVAHLFAKFTPNHAEMTAPSSLLLHTPGDTYNRVLQHLTKVLPCSGKALFVDFSVSLTTSNHSASTKAKGVWRNNSNLGTHRLPKGGRSKSKKFGSAATKREDRGRGVENERAARAKSEPRTKYKSYGWVACCQSNIA